MGGHRYWKASRRDKRNGRKSKRKDCRKKEKRLETFLIDPLKICIRFKICTKETLMFYDIRIYKY
jgi:hypothetical protein